MNNRILIIAIVVLIIIGAGAYLLTKNSTSTLPQATPTPTQAMMKEEATPTASPSTMMDETGTPSPSGSAKTGNVKEFTVTGSNYKFTPATLSVKKGDTVKITFTNSGGFHDFVIDEFNVKTKTIPDGQSETVQFVANKAGTFNYYCSVGNHRQMGMQGTLTVL